MKHSGIQYIAFCVILIFSSCEKNIAKKWNGDYYFTTNASSYYVGAPSIDSVLHFYGTVIDDSKNTLRIEYAPRLWPSPTSTQLSINVLGIITPTVDVNGNFTYPDYVSRDLHYFFHGGFADNGDINISIGFDGLGAGYANEIHGTRY